MFNSLWLQLIYYASKTRFSIETSNYLPINCSLDQILFTSLGIAVALDIIDY